MAGEAAFVLLPATRRLFYHGEAAFRSRAQLRNAGRGAGVGAEEGGEHPKRDMTKSLHREIARGRDRTSLDFNDTILEGGREAAVVLGQRTPGSGKKIRFQDLLIELPEKVAEMKRVRAGDRG